MCSDASALLVGLVLLGLGVGQWHAGPAELEQMLGRGLGVGGVAWLWVGAMVRDWAQSRRRPG